MSTEEQVKYWQEVALNYLAEREQQTAKWVEAAAERDAAESSRRAWAEEAMRLEMELDAALGAEGKALFEVERLEHELAAADDHEEKVECPDLACAYSFVGEERGRQLVDHYLRVHAADSATRPVCAVHEEGP